MSPHADDVGGNPTMLDDAISILRLNGASKEAITAVQRARLDGLVRHARRNSQYYARRYDGLPSYGWDIHTLPPVTKPELMDHFDEWLTDTTVRRSDVERFIAQKSTIGDLYLGQYFACTTSGTTGEPAILLHDRGAMSIFNALGYLRSFAVYLSPSLIFEIVRGGAHMAALLVTGGHYLGYAMVVHRHKQFSWRSKRQRVFSVFTPIRELVDALNQFQPVIVGGYPSALLLLAKEQEVGRLRLRPALMSCAGETLFPHVRRRIERAFGCRVLNYYGASEAVGLTFECKRQQLHVNTDWFILEPVNAANEVLPAGVQSEAVLLTNLMNRVQPIIRYRMGDRITVAATDCPCGSRFPVITVEGRTDDTLRLQGAAGIVEILPLAISTVAEETPGLYHCQVIQTAADALTVRFEPTIPGGEEEVWQQLVGRLGTYLAANGLESVRLQRAAEPPQVNPRSGKFREVWSEVKT